MGEQEAIDVGFRGELVIGLVGPLGTRLEDLGKCVVDALGTFGFESSTIRVSDLLRRFPQWAQTDERGEGARIAHLQAVANRVRSGAKDGASSFARRGGHATGLWLRDDLFGAERRAAWRRAAVGTAQLAARLLAATATLLAAGFAAGRPLAAGAVRAGHRGLARGGEHAAHAADALANGGRVVADAARGGAPLLARGGSALALAFSAGRSRASVAADRLNRALRLRGGQAASALGAFATRLQAARNEHQQAVAQAPAPTRPSRQQVASALRARRPGDLARFRAACHAGLVGARSVGRILLARSSQAGAGVLESLRKVWPEPARLSPAHAALVATPLLAAAVVFASWNPTIPANASAQGRVASLPTAGISTEQLGANGAMAPAARPDQPRVTMANSVVVPRPILASPNVAEASEPAELPIAIRSPPRQLAARAPVAVRPASRQPLLVENTQNPLSEIGARRSPPPADAAVRARQPAAPPQRACFAAIVNGPEAYRACLHRQVSDK